MGAGLADVAAEYVRLHRVERQSLQIRSVNRVELTNILDRAIHTTGMDDAEGVEEHASRETCVSREGSIETPTPATHVGRLSE